MVDSLRVCSALSYGATGGRESLITSDFKTLLQPPVAPEETLSLDTLCLKYLESLSLDTWQGCWLECSLDSRWCDLPQNLRGNRFIILILLRMISIGVLAVKNSWWSSVKQCDDGKPQSISLDWTRDNCSEKKSCSVLSKLSFSWCADIKSQRTSEPTSQHRDDTLVQDYNLLLLLPLLLLLCLRLILQGSWWLPVWCPSSSSSLSCPSSWPALNLLAAKYASLIEDWRCVSIWICLQKPEVNNYVK